MTILWLQTSKRWCDLHIPSVYRSNSGAERLKNAVGTDEEIHRAVADFDISCKGRGFVETCL